RPCLAALAGKLQTGEIGAAQVPMLREKLLPVLRAHFQKQNDPLALDCVLLASSFRDPEATEATRKVFAAREQPESARQRALEALTACGDTVCLDAVATALADAKAQSLPFRGQVLATLGRLNEPRVAVIVLERYGKMEPELQPRAIELLTQRVTWG